MKRYLVLVKCTDGNVRNIEPEAMDVKSAVAQAEADMLYYMGTGIDTVIDVREAS